MNTEETARYLQSLRMQHERVDALPPELMPPDLATAYQVQALLVDQVQQKIERPLELVERDVEAGQRGLLPHGTPRDAH